MSTATLHTGKALDVLRTLPDASVHTCVTSPPYFGLRDYGEDGQLGLEDTPAEYVSRLVGVLEETRRVLRDDGTLWLNLGDSYAGAGYSNHYNTGGAKNGNGSPGRNLSDLKPKDLIGIPWRVAFALQDAGWYLRSDIIWHKPNAMPESVKDRPTKAHEYLFLLTKSARYYYDHEAIKEDASSDERKLQSHHRPDNPKYDAIPHERYKHQFDGRMWGEVGKRNKRSVWEIPTQPFPEAHFAVFPPDLIEPCILAGCPEGGTVLDPFCGSGTSGLVALSKGRNFIGIDLNPKYVEMARRRIYDAAPMFFTVEVAA